MPPIRNYQHRPQCQTPYRQNAPHPSIGSGYWYPYPLRQLAISAKDIGRHRDPVILSWNQNRLWPCRKTLYNWRKRRQNRGHYNPYRRPGNCRATVLRGLEAFQMAWLLSIFPRINAAEISVFFYNANGQVRFYDPSQICRAQQRIGLSKKRSSTTAMQASYPINIQRRWSYWNLQYPFGIANISSTAVCLFQI